MAISASSTRADSWHAASARMEFESAPSVVAVASSPAAELPAVGAEGGSVSAGAIQHVPQPSTPPSFQLCGPATPGVSSGQRHVYMDMGANWANSLRAWQDLVERRSTHVWEIYAFEASPLIQAYVEEFVAWLNGEGPRPLLLIPPAGSTNHYLKLAKKFGCDLRKEQVRMRSQDQKECMWNIFKNNILSLKPNPALGSKDLIASRLMEASRPATFKSRYTFVPAGVSSSNSTIELDLAMGVIASKTGWGNSGKRASVIVVDIVNWISAHFRKEDFIFLKIDVEGAEHMVLDALIGTGKFELIDMLLWECHGNCTELLRRVKEAAAKFGTDVIMESNKFPGWDSCSSADIYFPIDPRQQNVTRQRSEQ